MSEDLYRFSEDQYKYELARRNELSGSISIPMGIISLIGGGIYLMLKEVRFPLTELEIGLVTVAIAALVSMVVSAVMLAIALAGSRYRYVSTARELKEWRRRVVQSYLDRQVPQEKAESFADSNLREALQEKFSEAAHHNTVLNDKRSLWLSWANFGMVFGLVFAFITGGLDLYISTQRDDPIEKVEIVRVPSTLIEGDRHEHAKSEPAYSGSDGEARGDQAAGGAAAVVGAPANARRPADQGGHESSQE
jgi:hypothetical protein